MWPLIPTRFEDSTLDAICEAEVNYCKCSIDIKLLEEGRKIYRGIVRQNGGIEHVKEWTFLDRVKKIKEYRNVSKKLTILTVAAVVASVASLILIANALFIASVGLLIVSGGTIFFRIAGSAARQLKALGEQFGRQAVLRAQEMYFEGEAKAIQSMIPLAATRPHLFFKLYGNKMGRENLQNMMQIFFLSGQATLRGRSNSIFDQLHHNDALWRKVVAHAFTYTESPELQIYAGMKKKQLEDSNKFFQNLRAQVLQRANAPASP